MRLIGPSLFVPLLACAVAIGGPSEPQPPADPRIRAEVETLVKDLGAREYRKREAAAVRLLEIGDDAVWSLRQAAESPDQEVRSRSREILTSIAWVPPETRTKLEEMARELASSRDPAKVGTLFNGLEANGKAGVKLLSRFFSDEKVRAEDFEIAAVFQKSVFRAGEPIACRATMRNKGETGAWIDLNAFSLHKGLADGEMLNMRRPQKPLFAIGGGGRNPGNSLLYLAGGEACEIDLSLPSDTLVPGRFSVTVHYSARGATGQFGQPRASGLPAWAPADLAANGPDVSLHLVPVRTGPQEGDPFLLEVSLAESVPAAGEPLSFSWTIEGDLPAVKKGLTATETLWAILLDGDEQPVAGGSVESDPEADGKSGTGTIVPPGPGAYTLVVGCSRRSPTVHVPKFDVVSKPVAVSVR